jgi:pimeloyl-ACP methyl ester carboxylesterase
MIRSRCIFACALVACAGHSRADGRADASAPLPQVVAPPEPALEVVPLEVPADVPVYFLRGAVGASHPIVFLHGWCSHAQGYVQAFQFAATKRGPAIGLQGDRPCPGTAYRSWSFDVAKQEARIEAAFHAAGVADAALREMVVIGYSQGESLAERLAEKYPDRYAYAVLIGAPAVPSVARLKRVRRAVMIAGALDANWVMKDGARALSAVHVPSLYIEMAHARHGQLLEGEKIMEEAFDWLFADSR